MMCCAYIIGAPEGSRALIEAGADPRAADLDGSTALHFAALYGQREMAEHLIRAGAQVDARGQRSATPLMAAVAHRTEEVASALLAAGADPRIPNIHGATPMGAKLGRGALSPEWLAAIARAEARDLGVACSEAEPALLRPRI